MRCHVYHTYTRESSVGSQYRLAQLGRNTARHPEETGKMEEAAVLEKKQINIFFHFPQNIGRMEDARQKKIRRPGKNFGNVGRMEEAVEEENNSKL